jgi:hypothetical protein
MQSHLPHHSLGSERCDILQSRTWPYGVGYDILGTLAEARAQIRSFFPVRLRSYLASS